LRDVLEEAGDFFEELENIISSFINEEEVIYFKNGIQILQDLDPSLQNSISTAVDMGFNARDLNSELLATLAIQDKLREELFPLIDELKEEASY